MTPTPQDITQAVALRIGNDALALIEARALADGQAARIADLEAQLRGHAATDQA